MSLIPLLLGRTSSQRATDPAFAGRHGYSPGRGHQPIAASLAFAVPAAIGLVYLLNPQMLPVRHVDPPIKGTLIELPKPPPPPPEPDAKPQPNPQNSVITAPRPINPIAPTPFDPVEASPPSGPISFDPGPVGVDPGPRVEDPPRAPVRTIAQLDKRFADRFQPAYPGRELREEREGRAKVRVLVGADGRVKAVEDLGASSPGFFTETKQQALSKWRFKPATEDGKPVESWFIVTVTFALRNA